MRRVSIFPSRCGRRGCTLTLLNPLKPLNTNNIEVKPHFAAKRATNPRKTKNDDRKMDMHYRVGFLGVLGSLQNLESNITSGKLLFGDAKEAYK